ncbi:MULTISPECIES: aspartate aminotransferase family protein [unclassified Chelatococcus]|uniref:aspartate aminotransferase family protein n=1 Tax=unclassified Chelatococcus TaxID=2638111 RepID=UPI001BD0823B|nr:MULTISPECIES: aspartate aminotransferase family protein [unclassified Chelatococcus]CAH1656276.1 Glutamate-1-semialdehyde 2,1-aminomutase [Hyphomicrobiales bacterium]MBS7742480.1 aspartate aminotransferase family protein [Chelatococcus sp. HY11]MBX3542402.1 aspartate aminotransferase family protein [Chelatococcus sp.]MCO5075381.1 aspartate aminotransferase family protein [Chelatococcus sp.]CAH1695795.1 Glutamate-1-semialdehyde 2,1-aminomutase [Hyphomicrobiales bacterium]
MTATTTEGHNSVGSASREAFKRAQRVFIDGTTRVTIERDPIPRYMDKGEGAYLVDVDGRRFLDLNGNFTTLIHGHRFLPVIEAVTRQLQSGPCFANPTLAEIDLAELICGRVPGVETIRFVNTGSEAVMFAIKAARAFTGRPAIAKIEGAYHGAYDWVEVSQASTPDNWGQEDAPARVPYYHGMPASVLREVVPLRFNDVALLEKQITAHAADLAAIVLDPMPSRAGLIAPIPEFVTAVQRIAKKHGVLIIADEVLSFRQGYEGASARYGLSPDLFTFGKIIGGGLPVGAIAGSRAVMSVFDASGGRPLLPQGGTFSANPLSMVAGLASMTALDGDAFAHLEQLGDRLREQLTAAIARNRAPFSVSGAASLFRIHPKAVLPRDFREATPTAAQAHAMRELSRAFAESGIILPNGAAACLSTPMTTEDTDHVASVFDDFLAKRSDIIESLAV